jgi:hypothetical protein
MVDLRDLATPVLMVAEGKADMRAQELILENEEVEMTSAIQNLIAQAEETGNKMAASRSLRYQLYIPRNTRYAKESTFVRESIKPRASIWTSTAIPMGENTYTSQWAEWCQENMAQWLSPKGQLYQVQPGARVLNIGSDQAARKIAKLLNHELQGYSIIDSYPWDKIGQLVDGIRYPARLRGSLGSRLDNILMSMWDVESTAWFNRDRLRLIGEVNVKTRGF